MGAYTCEQFCKRILGDHQIHPYMVRGVTYGSGLLFKELVEDSDQRDKSRLVLKEDEMDKLSKAYLSGLETGSRRAKYGRH